MIIKKSLWTSSISVLSLKYKSLIPKLLWNALILLFFNELSEIKI